MAIVRYRLDLANPPQMSIETAARLDAMTPEDVQRNAEDDPDNPPLTGNELERGRFARHVRELRLALGMTQTIFARTFQIDASILGDWEEGRFHPDPIARSYLKLIEASPDFVAKTIRADAAE